VRIVGANARRPPVGLLMQIDAIRPLSNAPTTNTDPSASHAWKTVGAGHRDFLVGGVAVLGDEEAGEAERLDALGYPVKLVLPAIVSSEESRCLSANS